MNIYKRHRFPSEIIQHAVWLYHRFNLSFRDIEDLLHERGIEVSYEAIRLWCNKFGPEYAKRLKKKRSGFGDIFHIDEVFVKINGVQHYLWRAVDQDGDVIDVFLQKRRDSKTAKRFFKRLLKANQGAPWKIVTDKMGSYPVAHKDLMPDVIHDTSQYANNKAELSHQPTRVREKVMRKFKSIEQGQRFLSTHAEIYNLFNLVRHCISAKNYKMLRSRAIASWKSVTLD